jgi:hypothetical protein
MTTPPPPGAARRALLLLLRLVLAVQAARLVLAVISGIAASTQHSPGEGFGAGPLASGAQRLLEFAGAGEGSGALLILLAVALLWLVSMLPPRDRRPQAEASAVSWLAVLTGVSALLAAAGYVWVASDQDFFPASQEIDLVGSALIYAGAMTGAFGAVRSIERAVPSSAAADGDEPGAAVFAVDRTTGSVLAWPSMSAARANAPLYGVEDDEYLWFLDDGTVVEASAEGQDVALVPTDEQKPDELLTYLKAYVQRRGLVIDDEDEPLAYIDPIARDHYLEMWPGWLRWIGRLTR